MEYYFKCPQCGSNESFTATEQEPVRTTLPVFLFGGFLPHLLYRADLKFGRVQCARCGYIFRQPPLPASAVCVFTRVVVGIVLACVALTVLAVALPEVTAAVPNGRAWKWFESVIAANPKAVIIGFVPMICLLVIASLIASLLGNRVARKRLRHEYETRPKPYSEVHGVKLPQAPAEGNKRNG